MSSTSARRNAACSGRRHSMRRNVGGEKPRKKNTPASNGSALVTMVTPVLALTDGDAPGSAAIVSAIEPRLIIRMRRRATVGCPEPAYQSRRAAISDSTTQSVTNSHRYARSQPGTGSPWAGKRGSGSVANTTTTVRPLVSSVTRRSGMANAPVNR